MNGWVRTYRQSKNVGFIQLYDGSCSKDLQIVISPPQGTFLTGDCIKVNGELIPSPKPLQPFEVSCHSWELLGSSQGDAYPLQKKNMTYEYLREIAHLRPRTSTFSSIFRLRSHICYAIHEFFNLQNFFYVNTPILTTNDGEGGSSPFRVTTLDPGEKDFSQDFFKEPSLLCVTGQLEAELLAMGLGKVYTFGPTFRAENSHTTRHLSEFWMIEPEMAFADLRQNQTLALDLLKFVVKKILTNHSDELECLQKFDIHPPLASLEKFLSTPHSLISYTDAVELVQKSKVSFEKQISWGDDLQTEHERYLCEKIYNGPLIIENYPKSLKAFYMYVNDDDKTVAAMDILVPGMGELIGGSQREHRLDILEKQMIDKHIPVDKFQWYLDTRRFGTCPHSGFGLGLERLISWITGVINVRDAIPFPRTPGNCVF